MRSVRVSQDENSQSKNLQKSITTLAKTQPPVTGWGGKGVKFGASPNNPSTRSLEGPELTQFRGVVPFGFRIHFGGYNPGSLRVFLRARARLNAEFAESLARRKA